ncbi:hypothetical protein M0657_011889 [Pyricularia oryzae]|nr:hypothetical protein M0657_011889 [Pyricularia oryzae]
MQEFLSTLRSTIWSLGKSFNSNEIRDLTSQFKCFLTVHQKLLHERLLTVDNRVAKPSLNRLEAFLLLVYKPDADKFMSSLRKLDYKNIIALGLVVTGKFLNSPEDQLNELPNVAAYVVQQLGSHIFAEEIFNVIASVQVVIEDKGDNKPYREFALEEREQQKQEEQQEQE